MSENNIATSRNLEDLVQLINSPEQEFPKEHLSSLMDELQLKKEQIKKLDIAEALKPLVGKVNSDKLDEIRDALLDIQTNLQSDQQSDAGLKGGWKWFKLILISLAALATTKEIVEQPTELMESSLSTSPSKANNPSHLRKEERPIASRQLQTSNNTIEVNNLSLNTTTGINYDESYFNGGLNGTDISARCYQNSNDEQLFVVVNSGNYIVFNANNQYSNAGSNFITNVLSDNNRVPSTLAITVSDGQVIISGRGGSTYNYVNEVSINEAIGDNVYNTTLEERKERYLETGNIENVVSAANTTALEEMKFSALSIPYPDRTNVKCYLCNINGTNYAVDETGTMISVNGIIPDSDTQGVIQNLFGVKVQKSTGPCIDISIEDKNITFTNSTDNYTLVENGASYGYYKDVKGANLSAVVNKFHSNTTNTGENTDKNTEGMSTGGIVVIAIGSLVLTAIMVKAGKVICCCCYEGKKFDIDMNELLKAIIKGEMKENIYMNKEESTFKAISTGYRSFNEIEKIKRANITNVSKSDSTNVLVEVPRMKKEAEKILMSELSKVITIPSQYGEELLEEFSKCYKNLIGNKEYLVMKEYEKTELEKALDVLNEKVNKIKISNIKELKGKLEEMKQLIEKYGPSNVICSAEDKDGNKIEKVEAINLISQQVDKINLFRDEKEHDLCLQIIESFEFKPKEKAKTLEQRFEQFIEEEVDEKKKLSLKALKFLIDKPKEGMLLELENKIEMKIEMQEPEGRMIREEELSNNSSIAEQTKLLKKNKKEGTGDIVEVVNDKNPKFEKAEDLKKSQKKGTGDIVEVNKPESEKVEDNIFHEPSSVSEFNNGECEIANEHEESDNGQTFQPVNPAEKKKVQKLFEKKKLEPNTAPTGQKGNNGETKQNKESVIIYDLNITNEEIETKIVNVRNIEG